MIMKSTWSFLSTSSGMEIATRRAKENWKNLVSLVQNWLTTWTGSIYNDSLINSLLHTIAVKVLATSRMHFTYFTQKRKINCIEISRSRRIITTWLYVVITYKQVVVLEFVCDFELLPGCGFSVSSVCCILRYLYFALWGFTELAWL